MQNTYGVPKLTLDSINNQIDVARRLNSYWQIRRPTRSLKLSGAYNFVINSYPNAQGYNRFVYWPDYRVAGTINNIVNGFKEAGINQVQVGSLYDMSRGQIGCYRRTAPLTEEVVAACSFDPLNPIHQSILNQLNELEIKQQEPYSEVTTQLLNTGAFPGFQGGLNYQQQAAQARQQLANELSYLPTGAFPGFPGGREYLTAQQRSIEQYGMKY